MKPAASKPGTRADNPGGKPLAQKDAPHPPAPSVWVRIAEPAAVLARWTMGALFVYMGLNKALDPIEFLKLVRQYNLVDSPWVLNAMAAGLPWFEVLCGLLLLAGVAVRGTALILILMLVPFTFVVIGRALEIQSALAIAFCAVKFDCGCGTGEVFICQKIIENALLLLACGWLVLSGRGRTLSARYQLTGG